MFLFRLISLLPFPVLYSISNLLYLVSYKLIGYRKKVVWQNLRNSFPDKSPREIKEIADAFYLHLCDLIVETIKLLTIGEEEFRKRARVSGIELPLEYVKRNQSIIALTGHSGNWEWLLQACQLYTPIPIEAVYKPLSNRFFDQLMLKIRGRFEARLIPMKDVPRSVIKRKNELWAIAMVADQTPLKSEIQFINTFMNQRTPWFVGAEKIARLAKTPVFYIGMRKTRRGHYEVYFEKLGDASTDVQKNQFPIIQAFSESLEKNIKDFPAFWLWSHRRWKHKV